MTIIKLTLPIIAFAISNSKNPIKTRFLILGIRFLIFVSLKLQKGEVWFPLIFFLLFTGGILIMFMILSSISPNEKSYKMKISKFAIIVIILVSVIPRMKEFPRRTNIPQTKRILTSGVFYQIITIVILLYFFSSININKREGYSIRSFQCYCQSNFVNYYKKSNNNKKLSKRG